MNEMMNIAKVLERNQCGKIYSTRAPKAGFRLQKVLVHLVEGLVGSPVYLMKKLSSDFTREVDDYY